MGDEIKLKGKLACGIHRYNDGHVARIGEYALPAEIRVKCTGDGDARRCTASYDDCPSDSVYEDTPRPAKAERRTVKGLKPPERVSRGRDNSGQWNTSVEWMGKSGWYGRNEQQTESFDLQAWDDDKTSGMPPSVFFRASVARRPYARGDLRMELDSGHIEVAPAELSKLAEVFKQTIDRGYMTRHGHVAVDEFDKAPPIRVGGTTVGWRRKDGEVRGVRRRRRGR